MEDHLPLSWWSRYAFFSYYAVYLDLLGTSELCLGEHTYGERHGGYRKTGRKFLERHIWQAICKGRDPLISCLVLGALPCLQAWAASPCPSWSACTITPFSCGSYGSSSTPSNTRCPGAHVHWISTEQVRAHWAMEILHAALRQMQIKLQGMYSGLSPAGHICNPALHLHSWPVRLLEVRATRTDWFTEAPSLI